MTKEASDQAFVAFEEELDKAEAEQLKRVRKLVAEGFLTAPSERFKSIVIKLKGQS